MWKYVFDEDASVPHEGWFCKSVNWSPYIVCAQRLALQLLENVIFSKKKKAGACAVTTARMSFECCACATLWILLCALERWCDNSTASGLSSGLLLRLQWVYYVYIAGLVMLRCNMLCDWICIFVEAEKYSENDAEL